MFTCGKNNKDFSIIGIFTPLNLPITRFKKRYWQI